MSRKTGFLSQKAAKYVLMVAVSAIGMLFPTSARAQCEHYPDCVKYEEKMRSEWKNAQSCAQCAELALYICSARQTPSGHHNVPRLQSIINDMRATIKRMGAPCCPELLTQPIQFGVDIGKNYRWVMQPNGQPGTGTTISAGGSGGGTGAGGASSGGGGAGSASGGSASIPYEQGLVQGLIYKKGENPVGDSFVESITTGLVSNFGENALQKYAIEAGVGLLGRLIFSSAKDKEAAARERREADAKRTKEEALKAASSKADQLHKDASSRYYKRKTDADLNEAYSLITQAIATAETTDGAAAHMVPYYRDTEGRILEAMGLYDQARESFTEAVLSHTHAPARLHSRCHLAWCLEKMAEYEQCIQEGGAALIELEAKRNDHQYRVFYLTNYFKTKAIVGISMAQTGRYKEAILMLEPFEQAETNALEGGNIMSSGVFAEALNTLAYAYHKTERHDKAIALYTSIMKNISVYKSYGFSEPSILNNRGVVHLSKGNHEAALSDFLKAIDLHPEDPSFRANLFNARMMAGDADRAMSEIKAFREKGSEAMPGGTASAPGSTGRSAAYYANQADELIKAKQYEQAYRMSVQALSIDPKNVEAAAYFIRAMGFLEDNNLIITLAKPLEQVKGGSRHSLVAQAKVLARNEKHAEALEMLGKAGAEGFNVTIVESDRNFDKVIAMPAYCPIFEKYEFNAEDMAEYRKMDYYQSLREKAAARLTPPTYPVKQADMAAFINYSSHIFSLAIGLYNFGDFADAKVFMLQTMDAYDRAKLPYMKLTHSHFAKLAAIHLRLGDIPSAIKEYQRSVDSAMETMRTTQLPLEKDIAFAKNMIAYLRARQ